MGTFTFVWQWVLMDVLVYAMAVYWLVFVVRNEPKPMTRIFEMIAFVFCYAAVYENFATLMGWYGYGKSVLMIFNVPASVPVMEYIVVYSGLRLADAMKIPNWTKPLFVGIMGMLTDLSLDPLSVSQRFTTVEGEIGRWTWFPAAGDVQIFAIPVYNFTGWILLCGYATGFIMLGRWLYAKSKEKAWVGYVYPFAAMILALGVMVSPLSSFLLWLNPLMNKGSFSEIIMIGLFSVLFVLLLVIGWKGKMERKLSLEKDLIIPLSVIGFHAMNLMFTLIGGYWHILLFTVPFMILHCGLVWFIWHQSQKEIMKSFVC